MEILREILVANNKPGPKPL